MLLLVIHINILIYFFGEINKIINISKNVSYNKKLINYLYKHRTKKLNQNPKVQCTNSISSDKGAFSRIKNEAAEIGYHIPIKPSKNIFQRNCFISKLGNDKDLIEKTETASTYFIYYKTETFNDKVYNGLSKVLKKKKIKDHKLKNVYNLKIHNLRTH